MIIFLLLINLLFGFKVTFVNETKWNMIKNKLNIKEYNEQDLKLCYFLGLSCDKI
jgi:hypothetical protein